VLLYLQAGHLEAAFVSLAMGSGQQTKALYSPACLAGSRRPPNRARAGTGFRRAKGGPPGGLAHTHKPLNLIGPHNAALRPGSVVWHTLSTPPIRFRKAMRQPPPPLSPCKGNNTHTPQKEIRLTADHGADDDLPVLRSLHRALRA
jgi:hypothetical protein